LVGLTADEERAFSLGGEASDEEQAPPATEFTVRLHWVKERELPELDDEFARTAGEKDSLEELRQEIQDQIRRHKQAEAEAEHQEAAVTQAVEGSSVVIPPQLVEREAQHRAEDLRSALDKRGIGLEQYLRVIGKDDETFKSDLLAEAEQTLKRSLVLEAVADAEGLEIDEAEVRGEIERALQGASDPARMVRQALARPETRARVEAVLKSRKAVDRLVELSGGTPPASSDESPPSSDDASSSSEEAPPTSGEHNA
jgi:trigger factor